MATSPRPEGRLAGPLGSQGETPGRRSKQTASFAEGACGVRRGEETCSAPRKEKGLNRSSHLPLGGTPPPESSQNGTPLSAARSWCHLALMRAPRSGPSEWQALPFLASAHPCALSSLRPVVPDLRSSGSLGARGGCRLHLAGVCACPGRLPGTGCRGQSRVVLARELLCLVVLRSELPGCPLVKSAEHLTFKQPSLSSPQPSTF